MTDYHDPDSCNACGDKNDVEVVDEISGLLFEAKTMCKSCGHVDYWTCGWFESGNEIESKCKTYNFN